MALDRSGRVGVVGLGYVGLPLALTLVAADYDVVGVDVDEERIEELRAGRADIADVTDSELVRGIDAGLALTTEYDELAGADCVSICVPTPLHNTGRPNLSYVDDAARRLAALPDPPTTVVLESTVYPGATEEIIGGAFEDAGFEVGEDVFVAFSPERIDPGNEEYGLRDIPKVLGGVTPACGDRVEATYRAAFEEVVRVPSARAAELVKLLENSFRSVNIGLINEFAMLAHELDTDIWSVVDAAATKPFGFMRFDPGPGLGGHCLPVDPVYLSWKADQHGADTRFIDLADQINREMPLHVVNRITSLLNTNGVPLADASVLVVGVSYKPDVADTRESPAFDVIGELSERGASVEYHDPYVPTLRVEETRYESQPLTPAAIEAHDCVAIITDHADLDVESIVEHAALVFDSRNATSGSDRDHVYRL